MDKQSTVDQFVNPKYLGQIKSLGQMIDMYCNAGKTSTNKHDMFGSIKVWYNPARIDKILSLKAVKSLFRVTYNNNDRGGVFTVYSDK